MELENYFDFLGSDKSDPRSSSAIRIKGHRIGIEHVLAYYREGYNPDEIAREFPGLSLEKIYAAITYYLSHQAEMDDYLARVRERAEREYAAWAAQSPPIVQRLRAIQVRQAQGQPA